MNATIAILLYSCFTEPKKTMTFKADHVEGCSFDKGTSVTNDSVQVLSTVNQMIPVYRVSNAIFQWLILSWIFHGVGKL